MINGAHLKSFTAVIVLCLGCSATSRVNADNKVFIPKPLTVVWMNEQLDAHDAKYVVKILWGQERYDEFLENISAGKSDWISLAPKIAPGTDAGLSEDLGISLAYALPKTPAAVLKILDQSRHPISFKRVCSIPFIEPTKKFYTTYAREALSAVHNVIDEQLSKQKKLCLTVLKHTATLNIEFEDQ